MDTYKRQFTVEHVVFFVQRKDVGLFLCAIATVTGVMYVERLEELHMTILEVA
jgi:hypothetical protein